MSFQFTTAQNAISVENALAGTPQSQWDISGAGDLTIQGFATDMSFNLGDTVKFKIKTDAANYTINIYRIGYYQGNGARLVGTGVVTATLPQTQPLDLYDVTTGKTDCSNWDESGYWICPANAVSGIYIAKLTRTDNNGSSHIAFVIRNDASTANILFKTSDATWQAYNAYGGNSLYVNNSGTPVPGFVHATKVSYNRPFYTRSGGGGGGAEEDWLMNCEYPMIRFMEKNGYDVTYTTDVDMDRSNISILPSVHKVMLSVGHDEYWSAAERIRFENARNAGVHLAFFSGNEVYWKTRWEDNHRTLVCYKEGTYGENTCGTKCDPLTTVWTGNWRDGCAYPLADGCNNENSLTGQMSWDGTTGAVSVPHTYKSLRFWRNTAVANLGVNQSVTFANGTLGYEWDWEQSQYASTYPANRVHLSQTTLNNHTHHLTLYRHANGALVFGAGTVQWMWGLDSVHDRGNAPPDISIQQSTVNLFAEMGVQPATLQPNLVSATSTGDLTPPVSVITFPNNNDSAQINTPIVITGTASDAGVVAAVDVSVDGGTTWARATGTTSWSYNWTPTTIGTTNIKTRAIDDWGNMETSGGGISIVLTVQPCPCSVFPPSSVPASVDNYDNIAGIELGMKFRSNVNGYISAVRFYKGATSNGNFTGHLWTSSGTSLAVATLNLASGSGWQQINLATPVAITANTTYVVSYHSPGGYYPITNPYFSSAVINGPLKGLANGEDGTNGIYNYTPTPAFPNSNYQSSNYWVDVVFDTIIHPDTTAPLVLATSPANSATAVTIASTITVTFNESMDTTTLSSSTIQLKDAQNNTIPTSITRTLSGVVITPNTYLAYNTVYTVTIIGGVSGTRAKDLAGNALTANYSFSFTTAATPANQGPGGPVLIISSGTNPFSRYTMELLKAEGLNAFLAMDISAVTPSVLNNYDIAILGEIPLTNANVTMLTDWVTTGGKLITFKPDAQLYNLLGISNAGGTLSNKYILVNTSSELGVGITNQTMQFHGTANQFTLNGASSIATLYSNATTSTAYPAVTTKNVGSLGGVAIAFAYDLCRSIVYTRQGNPAWAGDERDGQSGPIRSNDLFYGAKSGDVQTDWVDLSKVAIPQADEQQRFLANIILHSNLSKKPLPRFWYFPKGLKAAVVMTGDDHAGGGTVARFDQYKTLSSSNTATAVEDWIAIRGSSYIYANTPITNTQVTNYKNDGFEIGLHVNTGCSNYTESSLASNWTSQYASFTSAFPGAATQTTNRTHCIAWSDWATQAKVQAARGIRMDVNYYYFPGSWIQNRPGMFTGSGLPMRFADLDGSIIDCYQVATQLTDESGQTLTTHITSLLDSALGSSGFYGAFCANMHTDNGTSTGSDEIIAVAQAKNIPVISAAQLLKWVDAREASTFNNLTWSNNKLSFTITAAANSKHLKAMLPINADDGVLDSLFYNGSPISYSTEIIKGIAYAFFDATLGNATYEADYESDTIAPTISNISAVANASGQAIITWLTSEASTSEIAYDTVSNSLAQFASNMSMVTSHTLTLTGLVANKVYYYRVTSADVAGNNATYSLSPAPPLNFIVPTDCFFDDDTTNFLAGTTNNIYISKITNGEMMLQPGKTTEFDVLPPTSEWNSFAWTGGTSAVSSGVLNVNGARYNTQPVATTYGPGSSLEFVATFGASAFQHIGFGGGDDATGSGGIYNGENSWAMFSTHNTSNTLKARTFVAGGSSSDFTITGINNLIGSPHRYRIDWKTDGSFDFYVDGTLVRAESLTISTQMRPAASDYNNDGTAIAIDWIRVSPYASSGVFESRVYTANTPKSWNNITWNAETPNGTSITMMIRTGNVPTPDGTWTTYDTMATSGISTNKASSYVQYKAVLTTTDTKLTPVLSNISITCSPVMAPTVSLNPDSLMVCQNTVVNFVSWATSNPNATVQWQVSTNAGNSWSDVGGATNDTLSFTAILADTNKLFRAVWTNAGGTVTSTQALLRVNATGTWIGGTNTDWNTTTNWCGGAVPNTSTDVVVNADAPFMPIVDANETLLVRDLIIDNGATLTINGTLNATGNITNHGALTATNGIVILSGTTQQLISGNAFSALNMELDNIAGASLQTTVSIINTYTPSEGILTTNGNLVILSTATGTGRIATIPIGADISGNVTVQRFVPAVVRRSRMLSPNTSSFNFSQLIDDMFITGTGGATNGFDVSVSNQQTVYTYQETAGGTGRGWKTLTNISNTLSPGLGALVFVRGDRTLTSPQWYTPPYVAQNAVTIDFTGPINKGDISPPITYTSTGNVADDGWNMVGNPYPSQISWNAITKNNIGAFYYQLNPSTGSYVAQNGSNLIASGQAFFIQTFGASPSLTFTENSKASSAPVNYFKTAQAEITAHVFKDSLNSDMLKIAFATGSNINYSPAEDAIKLTNSVINFAVLVNNKNIKLQHHQTPLLTAAIDTVSLYMDGPVGSYEMTFSGLQTMQVDYDIFIYDAFTNNSQNLKTNSAYTFAITANAASKGSNRFSLLFVNPTMLPVRLLSFNATANNSDVQLNWQTNGEKNNNGFFIDRSENAIFGNKEQWQNIAFVKSKAPLQHFNNYTYTDVEALEKVTRQYYRLRQQDFNGAITESKVVHVQQNDLINQVNNIQVYPNPFTGKTGLYVLSNSNSNIEISVVDIAGKLVLKQQLTLVEGQNEYTLNGFEDAEKGIYFLTTSINSKNIVLKLVKQ